MHSLENISVLARSWEVYRPTETLPLPSAAFWSQQWREKVRMHLNDPCILPTLSKCLAENKVLEYLERDKNSGLWAEWRGPCALYPGSAQGHPHVMQHHQTLKHIFPILVHYVLQVEWEPGAATESTFPRTSCTLRAFGGVRFELLVWCNWMRWDSLVQKLSPLNKRS